MTMDPTQTAKVAAENLQLRRLLGAALEDSERLEWVIATLNRVGTNGFGNIVRWGCEGLTREDIDCARKQE